VYLFYVKSLTIKKGVMMARWLYSLDELGKEENDLVGKKCANLGELKKAGFRVPQGFALALTAYERFIKETGVINEIKDFFRVFSADANDPADGPKYEEASRVIRKIMENREVPQDMADRIGKQYQDMWAWDGPCTLPVAIRSAGPASHPGQYETYLFVSGTSDVLRNIKRVWSSTFNQRSIIARHRLGLPLHYDPIGVAVMGMVKAKAAGVMFTVNPVNGDLSKIMLEGNWGLGESVVSGSVTPDRWMVDKVTFEVIKKVVSAKLMKYEMDRERGQPRFCDIPQEKQNVSCLNEEELLEIARIGKEIERYFGMAQDIEWAVDMDLPFPDNVFVLQTRPAQLKEEKGSKRVFEAGKTGLAFVQDIATWGKL
jgi:pyruvate,water dikinase